LPVNRSTTEWICVTASGLRKPLPSRSNVQSAVMASFSTMENIRALRREIGKIDPGFGDIEIEELALYGNVEERLRKAKIPCKTAWQPRDISPEQV